MSKSSIISPLNSSHFPISAQGLIPQAVHDAGEFHLKVLPPPPVKAWFTDLDGTVFDGKSPPDTQATEVFHHLVQNLSASNIPVIYVTGRSLNSINKAITKYSLPEPLYAAAATGTMIFSCIGGVWNAVEDYARELSSSWIDNPAEIFDGAMVQAGISNWSIHFRGEFRHAYTSAPEGKTHDHQQRINSILITSGIKTIQVVVSGPGNEGLFHYDFVPINGSKLYAARFIAEKLLGFNDLSNVLFTGDSGNDSDLLLAAGFSTLVHSEEEGLSELLRSQRQDIHLSPYRHIYGVVDAMMVAGCIWPTPSV